MIRRIKNLFNIKNKQEELSTREKIDILFDNLSEDIILLNLGSDLSQLWKLFSDIIHEIREEIKQECGFIIPEVRIQESSVLQENEFKLYIQGRCVECGFLIPNEEGIRNEFYDCFKTNLYNNVEDTFTNEITERYIDTAQKKNGWLVWNIASRLSVPEIKIILSDIINSGKSINNIGYIFEKIGEQILLNGGYQDYIKAYNPHEIAKSISKVL